MRKYESNSAGTGAFVTLFETENVKTKITIREWHAVA
jgi:hypothetical protein